MTINNSILSSPKSRHDEHEVEISILLSRLQTDIHNGLTSDLASQRQSEDGPNMLPTDMDSGHGAIHELIAVLRDGGWIHSRAENLVVGDIITLKQGHSVPADARIFQSEDLWVDNSCLTGKRFPEQKGESNMSVFESQPSRVPYMEARNIVFYGTKIVRGSARAIVLRTGAKTVLGEISRIIANTEETDKDSVPVLTDENLLDEIRSLGVSLKDSSSLQAVAKGITTVVCEHTAARSSSVVTVVFGSNPPTVVKSDMGIETSGSEVEQDLIAQLMGEYQENDCANAFMRAMAACSNENNNSSFLSYEENEPQFKFGSINERKQTISSFCNYFGRTSPSHNKKKRYRSYLCGTLSGCEVYVHFDEECGAHVVLLEGPVREILSRCGKVYCHGKIETLETVDLTEIHATICQLEKLEQSVCRFAELYLDSKEFPVNFEFDIEKLNFPTEQMCFLGALGISERLHSEVIKIFKQAQATNVRVIITSDYSNSNVDDSLNTLLVDINLSSDNHEEKGHKNTRNIPLKLNELETDKPFQADYEVISSELISISNTLTEWQNLLLKSDRLLLCGCTPAQVDLIVETLQDLGEKVAFISSGNANALTMKRTDLGFALPSNNEIDLCEEAASIVLGFSDSPRCDAIRILRIVKQKQTSTNLLKTENDTNLIDCKESEKVIKSLFEDVIRAAKLMNLSDKEIRECAISSLDNNLGRKSSMSVGNIFSSLLGAAFHQN